MRYQRIFIHIYGAIKSLIFVANFSRANVHGLTTCLAAWQRLDVSLGETYVFEANFPRHQLHLLLELSLSTRKQLASNYRWPMLMIENSW